MPRKKNVVEGAVLDLRDMSGGVVDVTALVAAEEAEKVAVAERKKAESERKKAEKAAAVEKRKAERAVKRAEALISKKEEIALARYNKWIKKKEEKARKKGIVHKEEIIEEFDVKSYIDSIVLHKCVDCDRMILFNDRCSTCRKVYIEAKSKRIMEYIDEKGMTKCNFCGINRGSDCTGFHFDHLNMFLKTGTVGQMIGNDTDDHIIMEEIDKCQLLCVSCHLLVTKIELKYGFTQRKIKLGKGIGNLEDLVKEYDSVMIPAYELIKNKFRVGGAI
jgi:hypothetical protein